MTHKISINIAYVLLNHQLIDSEDLVYAAHYIECNILKTIAITLTFLISFLTDSFPGLILFFVFYASIRKYAGGFHCKSQVGCTILSVLSLIIVSLTKTIVLGAFGIVSLMLSITFILIKGATNHPNLELDLQELIVAKRRARLVAILELSVIIFAYMLNVRSDYIAYMIIGIEINAISIIVSIITRQEVKAE